ncbi:MAG TPA: NfeD family protein [Acidimicrobiales bacterium]|nr:NfeD family protein [Acidimicrobiales bacterium]
MRRLPSPLGASIAPALALVLLGAALLAAAPAGAAAQAEGGRHVDVIEVIGLVDAVQVDFVEDALRRAEEGGAEALVIQVDSSGGIADRDDLDALLFRMAHSTVPVAVWVGPSGGQALGQGFELVEAAGIAGIASRGRLGPRDRPVPAARAAERGLVEIVAPTLGDFIVELDGREVGGTTLETARVVREDGSQPRRQPTVDVRFAKLGLMARLLHTAASPSVAYLLFAAGLGLIVLELFTAGIGVAAFTGAVCLVLASYGLAALPSRPYAVALLALSFLAYAVDVQAGTPRTWTAVGTVLLAVGSVRLYEDGLAPSWVVLVTVVGGTALLMVAGLPAMLRARFSTPTIGRESMVGETGAAVAAVDPEGTVEVRGATWRARTNRATPIEAGDAVRVVAIDGLLLEVEPAEGGAKDYRKH